MLNFSPEKLFLVGLIALVVLGPHRLPQAARTVGRFMAEMRRMSASFQDEVRDALGEPTETIHSAISDFRPPTNLRRSVHDVITTTLTPAPRAAAGAAAPGASPPATTPPATTPPAGPSGHPPPVTAAPLTAPDDPALN
jgi:sec-independent protein translocase protein TatB